eukprot:COSAG01_NODE_1791_length_9221_cov_7.677373_2_plen_171_part_00
MPGGASTFDQVGPSALTHGLQCQILPQAHVPPLTAWGHCALHVSWCRGPMTALMIGAETSDVDHPAGIIQEWTMVSDCPAGSPRMCRPPCPPSPYPLCPWSCPLCLSLLSSPCSVSLCAAGGAGAGAPTPPAGSCPLGPTQGGSPGTGGGAHWHRVVGGDVISRADRHWG